MAEGSRSGVVRRTMEHPMGKLIIGFIMTGIVGQSLSWAYNERREKERLNRAALESIRQFSTLEEALRERADQLRDTISRGAPAARVEKRAQAYYDASVAWGAAVDANNLRFREFFGFTGRNYIEAAIEDALVPMLLTIDSCITDAELAIAGDDPAAAMQALGQCDGDDMTVLLEATHECSYALTSTMTHYVMTGLECGDDAWRDNGWTIYQGLMNACSMEPDAQSEVWPYAGQKDAAYDMSCIRDDRWYERFGL